VEVLYIISPGSKVVWENVQSGEQAIPTRLVRLLTVVMLEMEFDLRAHTSAELHAVMIIMITCH
jgi:hypothetical protein